MRKAARCFEKKLLNLSAYFCNYSPIKNAKVDLFCQTIKLFMGTLAHNQNDYRTLGHSLCHSAVDQLLVWYLYSNSIRGSVCLSVCYQTRPRPMNRLKKKIDGYIPPIAEHVLIYMAF